MYSLTTWWVGTVWLSLTAYFSPVYEVELAWNSISVYNIYLFQRLPGYESQTTLLSLDWLLSNVSEHAVIYVSEK